MSEQAIKGAQSSGERSPTDDLSKVNKRRTSKLIAREVCAENVRLRVEIARLREANAKMEPLLKEVMQWHSDPESSDYNECDTDPCMWCDNAVAALEKKE